MTKNRYYKIAALVLTVALGSGISYYFLRSKKEAICAQQGVTISPYLPSRDEADVVGLFERDWYWLSVNEYSRDHVLFMLNTGSPNEEESRYFGKMQVQVLRDPHGAFIGFITYYMKNFYQGHILFLAVHQDFRGKRYADCLLKYAINALKNQGAKEAILLTYTPNTSGQKLYNRFGFIETHREGKFVYYKYPIAG
jgi:ribosomal protein S18 acetylase RimI-like enzyme